jgi:predicted MPP superfamily phosphohydrolase
LGPRCHEETVSALGDLPFLPVFFVELLYRLAFLAVPSPRGLLGRCRCFLPGVPFLVVSPGNFAKAAGVLGVGEPDCPLGIFLASRRSLRLPAPFGLGACPPRNGPVAALGLGSLLFGILWAGYRKAQHPKIRRLFLPLHASPQGVLPLRVVVASDLHAEGFLQRQHLERVVHCIQRCKPDLVLLPGDLLDGPPEKLKEDGVEGIFRKLCAPYGVLACTGNHEFFVGIEEAVRLLTRCGIRVLREEFWVAEPGLVVVGREDFAGEYFPGGRKRRRLKEILAGVDPTLPVVVMDHRPRDLQEAAECGVDLMVCGHTHNGQFWPVSWIVRALFPVSYGYQKIGKTHVYVTSGAGTWGPPVRLGSSPEVVVFELTPGESSSKELAKETLPFG